VFSTGIMIIPKDSIEDVLAAARTAEEAGYDFCLIADEGFNFDVYTLMTRIVANTEKLKVAPMTNPYTRHPATTAVALASVNAIAPGRVFVNLVAGGSLVLGPMNLTPEKPVSTCRDAVHIIRSLTSGNRTDFEGSVYSLRSAQIEFPTQPIEIWVMGRGPKMVQMAGEEADVTVITSHVGAENTVELARAGAAKSGRKLKLAQLCSMAFNQEIVEQMRPAYTFVIPDSPTDVWNGLGVSAEWVANLKRTREEQGIGAATALITDEIISKAMVVGTPEECVLDLCSMSKDDGYEIFIMPVMSLEQNYAIPLIRDASKIYLQAKERINQ
jgi:5,10-methylenetetrahydromethanopterin reductase